MGVIDCHVEDVGDVVSLVGDFQGFTIVTAAVTQLAFDKNVGEEMHLDAFDAVPFASFATAAFHIERKSASVVTPHPRCWKAGEEFPYRSECADVSHRIGTRCATDGGLVDDNHFVHLLQAAQLSVGAWFFLGAM